jgi:hypothetical protein
MPYVQGEAQLTLMYTGVQQTLLARCIHPSNDAKDRWKLIKVGEDH